MKGILIAGVFAAFAIAVIDSLNCTKCESFNSTCHEEASECGDGFSSCVESSVNSTLGGSLYLYQNKFCSKDNCIENKTTQVAFTVRVSANQSYHFASQCCQGETCNDTNPDSPSQAVGSIKCSSCYSYNTTTCQETELLCYEGEQCVHIITIPVNRSENRVELKGCSDISQSSCDILSPVNTTFGGFIFQSVQCANVSTTTQPVTVTTTTPDSATIKASFASVVFGSLLLLKLLF
ncbi:ly6/PLAUR domain-containing protein 8 [Mesocricetus auratus]|uniref:Ly6/PLAUR domain-containing protein 8 n=1 Tax=Mesocricetus auratus TaxID=10036 RepID=A0A1U7QI19_MESAU|nr:ly6/PLAUR domain-containing protein 8 [Mesocricetus auratus]